PLGAREHRRRAETRAEPLRELAHGKSLRPRDVDHERRRRRARQTLDGNTIRVALPDDVHVAHRQRNRLTAPNANGDVDEHAIAQIDGVIEPNTSDARTVAVGGELEEPLATDA